MDRNIDDIEITLLNTVALRKESVDRNDVPFDERYVETVALRKESVDRNFLYASCMNKCFSRSPQGERG